MEDEAASPGRSSVASTLVKRQTPLDELWKGSLILQGFDGREAITKNALAVPAIPLASAITHMPKGSTFSSRHSSTQRTMLSDVSEDHVSPSRESQYVTFSELCAKMNDLEHILCSEKELRMQLQAQLVDIGRQVEVHSVEKLFHQMQQAQQQGSDERVRRDVEFASLRASMEAVQNWQTSGELAAFVFHEVKRALTTGRCQQDDSDANICIAAATSSSSVANGSEEIPPEVHRGEFELLKQHWLNLQGRMDFLQSRVEGADLKPLVDELRLECQAIKQERCYPWEASVVSKAVAEAKIEAQVLVALELENWNKQCGILERIGILDETWATELQEAITAESEETSESKQDGETKEHGSSSDCVLLDARLQHVEEALTGLQSKTLEMRKSTDEQVETQNARIARLSGDVDDLRARRAQDLQETQHYFRALQDRDAALDAVNSKAREEFSRVELMVRDVCSSLEHKIRDISNEVNSQSQKLKLLEEHVRGAERGDGNVASSAARTDTKSRTSQAQNIGPAWRFAPSRIGSVSTTPTASPSSQSRTVADPAVQQKAPVIGTGADCVADARCLQLEKAWDSASPKLSEAEDTEQSSKDNSRSSEELSSIPNDLSKLTGSHSKSQQQKLYAIPTLRGRNICGSRSVPRFFDRSVPSAALVSGETIKVPDPQGPRADLGSSVAAPCENIEASRAGERQTIDSKSIYGCVSSVVQSTHGAEPRQVPSQSRYQLESREKRLSVAARPMLYRADG